MQAQPGRSEPPNRLGQGQVDDRGIVVHQSLEPGCGPMVAIYDFLTWLQESLVRALS